MLNMSCANATVLLCRRRPMTSHSRVLCRSLQDDDGNIEGDEGYYMSESRKRMVLNIGSTRSKLVIDCVTPTMTGEYSCVADVPTDRVAASTQVNVGTYGNIL